MNLRSNNEVPINSSKLLPDGHEGFNETVAYLLDITERAGDIIMKYRQEANYSTEFKNNDPFDPVTSADRTSDIYLRAMINDKYPYDSILSEEYEDKDIDYRKPTWMIDSLDGTKDYDGRGERFSVMIGYCKGGVPSLGVVYLPASRICYYAVKGLGAYKKENGKITKLHVSDIGELGKASFFGKSQFSEARPIEDTMKKALGIEELLVGGSIGLVLGEIAEGKGDAYLFTNPRAGKRDTCAPQIILEEAGGVITDADGNNLDYTTPGYKLKNYFIASNGKIHSKVIDVSRNIYAYLK